MQRVEELADAHRAYAQLFEVCQLQGDDFKLHSIMMRHRTTDSGNHLDLEQSAVAYVFDRYAHRVASFALEPAGYCFCILSIAFMHRYSSFNAFWLMMS